MEASIDLGPASSSDNLSDTTDYASFAREVSVALEVARYADLTDAANATAEALLMRESKMHAVLLTLHDPRAVLGDALGDVSVSVMRKQRSTQ